jgi:hypothetical protein
MAKFRSGKTVLGRGTIKHQKSRSIHRNVLSDYLVIDSESGTKRDKTERKRQKEARRKNRR